MIGRFYFRRTINGNLVGEFSNNHSTAIQTESAERNGRGTNFIGTYQSTWNDDDGPTTAVLTIRFKPRTNTRIYLLIWREVKGATFWGEAMLCDDLLIGDYRDFEHIEES